LALFGCSLELILDMSAQEENEAISALTGFSLDHLLTGLSLPAGTSLSNQLGISGIPTLNSSQIYNDKWEEGAVGPGQGEDWEEQVDREMEEEDEFDQSPVKTEFRSPDRMHKQKRVRVIKRLIERPKSVYERFPAFEKDKILDFSELFKGYTARKSRLVKRPFHGMCSSHDYDKWYSSISRQWRPCIHGGETSQEVFWMLSSVTQRDKWRVGVSKRLCQREVLKSTSDVLSRYVNFS
jgi:hypothetical protein